MILKLKTQMHADLLLLYREVVIIVLEIGCGTMRVTLLPIQST
jgi:hypothetical protein